MKKISKKQEFETEIAGGDRIALFYSAYCPFCSAFLPSFEKAAGGEPALFIKVCTDDLPELEDLFAVEVVPTALFFRKGKLCARLDGKLGRGLSETDLSCFIGRCGAKK